MTKYAVIVAGGSGLRLGSELPKQFCGLDGHPMLWYSLKAFHDEDPTTKIIVVLHKDFCDFWQNLCLLMPFEERVAHEVVTGGSSRTESVKNGLALVPDEEDALVAVHDAARPLVSTEMISEGWKAASRHGAAIPAVAVTDSLRRLEGDSSRAVDRSEFVAVQTPQVFGAKILKGAYAESPGGTFTDDASAVEQAGKNVALFEGSHTNMKVTSPGDLEIAATLLRQRNKK